MAAIRVVNEPLEDGQGELDHGVTAGQREANVARQPHDLSGYHQHLFLHELPREFDAAEASWAPEQSIIYAWWISTTVVQFRVGLLAVV